MGGGQEQLDANITAPYVTLAEEARGVEGSYHVSEPRSSLLCMGGGQKQLGANILYHM
jgi:hypothetical protein